MRLAAVFLGYEIEVLGGGDTSQQAEEVLFDAVGGVEEGGQRLSRVVEKVPDAAFDVDAFALLADFVDGFKDVQCSVFTKGEINLVIFLQGRSRCYNCDCNYSRVRSTVERDYRIADKLAAFDLCMGLMAF